MSTVRFPHLGFNSSNLLLAREISVRVIQIFITFDKPQKISIRINQVFKSYCWQRKKISMSHSSLQICCWQENKISIRVIQVFESFVSKKNTSSVWEVLPSFILDLDLTYDDDWAMLCNVGFGFMVSMEIPHEFCYMFGCAPDVSCITKYWEVCYEQNNVK